MKFGWVIRYNIFLDLCVNVAEKTFEEKVTASGAAVQAYVVFMKFKFRGSRGRRSYRERHRPIYE